MANKYSLVSSVTATDRLVGLHEASVTLSDGTLVFVYLDPAVGQKLVYSSDHSTINSIDAAFVHVDAGGGDHFCLCRDASDNLYVGFTELWGGVGVDGLGVTAYKKGAGYTWTRQAISANNTVIAGSPPPGCSIIWCNTGGGTGGSGHLILATQSRGNPGSGGFSSQIWTYDAGALLAGTGPGNLYGYGASTLVPGGVAVGTASGYQVELEPDGFGGTTGLAASQNYSAGYVIRIASWAISNTGAITSQVSIGDLTSGTLGINASLRLIRYASGAWAVVYPSSVTAGKVMIARYSSTAQVTAGTEYGTITNFPSPAATQSWDAILDPVAANTIWVYGWSTLTATTMLRISAAVGAGVTWDSAATVDDTAVGTGTNTTIRTVKAPITTKVDWMTFNNNAGTYALLGDYTQFAVAPNPPTLTAPLNGSTMDLAGGVTFSWTYSNAVSSDTQSAYALRIKVSGGSYNYWNGSALQAGEIFINSGAGSVAIPAAILSDGNTVYNWSVNTKETNAGLTGTYASDFTVTGSLSPAVVVTAPTSTVTIASPAVSWTFAPGTGGDTQSTYQIKVESGAYGIIPGSGTLAWDSTETTDTNARSRVVGVALANTVTYRAFVRCKESNALYSTWVYSTFTESFDPPATPSMTATYDAANSRTTLVLTGKDNLLTANQASFEAGTTTGFAAGANTTIAATASASLNGAYSMSLTSTAAGAVSATTPTGVSGFAVLPSTQYTAASNFRTAVSARACLVTIFWYQAGGTASAVRASDASATTNDGSAGWLAGLGVSETITSPSDAAFAAVVVTVQATGAGAEVHYVDQVGVFPGTATAWTRGGLTGAQTAQLYSSDDAGATWQYVRGGNTLTPVTVSQAVTAYDYEAPPGVARSYRMSISSSSLVSAFSPTVTATPVLTSWWLKNPTNSAQNMSINVVGGHGTTKTTRSAIHYVLGSVSPVTVTDVVTGNDGSISVLTITQADYVSFEALIKANATLLLQSPFGSGVDAYWYILPGQPSGGAGSQQKQTKLEPSAASAPYRTQTLSYVATSAPALP